MKLKKASTKNVYFPEGNSAAAKWRITTTYREIKSHGSKWTCQVEKKILHEWKDLAVEYEMSSEKDCLKWATETVIMMHGIKL